MTKTIVYTGGTWDLFHIGHLNIIEKSKQYGDYLIVGVSTDEVVKSYKKIKPFIPYDERYRIIEALRCVDQVVKQEVLLDIKIFKKHKVDVVTIGDDWKNHHLDGLDWMKKQGKKVVFLPYTKGLSSNILRKRICNEWMGGD